MRDRGGWEWAKERGARFFIALCALALQLAPLRASAQGPSVELGAGATAVAGSLEHDYARPSWPMQPGSHVQARVVLIPNLVVGASFDSFYRRLEPAGGGPDRPAHALTSMPLAFAAGRLALGPNGWWLRGSFGIGAALDRRREPFVLPASLYPDAIIESANDARAAALAHAVTLAASAPLGDRFGLELEAGWLCLTYFRNPSWARGESFGSANASGYHAPDSTFTPDLSGTHHALMVRLTALVRLGR